MEGLNLSSEVKIFPCPNCGQTINTSMAQCAFCAAPVDAGTAIASADAFSRVNQAISDASYLKIMAGTSMTFFLVSFLPFVGMIGGFGFLFLEVAIPVMLIRWWVKFGSIKSPDAEFIRAKKSSLIFGGGAILAFIILNIGTHALRASTP